MNTPLIVFHYFICTFLIVLILLQAGKGADIGAAFGGASQTVFGGRGPATFLSKLTTVAAVLFLITSISLAQMSKKASVKSVLDTMPVTEQTAPAPTTNVEPEQKTPEMPPTK